MLRPWGDAWRMFASSLEHDLPAVRHQVELARDFLRGNLQFTYHAVEALAYAGAIDEALDWLTYAIPRGFVNWRFMSEHDVFLVPQDCPDLEHWLTTFLRLQGRREGRAVLVQRELEVCLRGVSW